MKKRLVVSLLIGLFIMSALADQYLKQSFQLSLGEYVRAMQPYTSEEKEWLKNHPIINYGADSNSPPLRYVDPETLQYKGIVVDYLDALSIELGASIDFTPMIWKDALNALSNGFIDICDMHPSEERTAHYDFSTPIYYQRGVILTKKDSPIQSEADLSGHTIAGNEGDYIFEYLENTHPDVKAIAAKDLEAAISLLKDGRVDAVLGDESVILYFMDKENLSNDYYLTDDFLYVQEAVIAVKKGNTQLLSIINKGITRLKTKNTMTKINQKWYTSQPLITKDTSKFKWQFILELLSITLLLSLIIFYYWNRELTKEVNKRTQDLNASTKVLETTFDGLEQFLIVLDENKTLIECNNAFATFSKLNKNALKGRSYNVLPSLLQGRRLQSTIERAYKDQVMVSTNFEHKHRSYKASGYPLEGPNKTFQLLLFIEDITESIVQQQQLLQSRKMIAVGQLAAGVAHEIRNPIGLIRNHNFLLKRFLKKHMTPDIEDSLQVMDQSVERVNSIINNLLNFSRQETIEPTTLSMKAFIEDMISLNKKQIEKKNAQITLICDDKLQVLVYVESMKHIIMNLLSNALEAIDKNGEISIELTQENKGLELRFSDNGSGIPNHIIETIFDPFFTTKSPDGGTGLGLYIVYNEVEKMNGTVTVESVEGQSTSFKVFIPADNYPKKEAHNE
jgi:polar amino acid transport system substrate-binding protein